MGQIKAGQGQFDGTCKVSVGGYINDKKVSTDWIIVKRDLLGRRCLEKFRLNDLVDEMAGPQTRMAI